jgi:nifR3 family TIM-barrel protein
MEWWKNGFQGDEMKLGNLHLSSNLVMAPISGVTDYPFRQLTREMGCGFVLTEMVSAEGILRKGQTLLRIEKDDHPVSVQFFGSDPVVLAEAAARAESSGADAIDLNMGCPAKQVVKTGAGADLMRFPERARAILDEMRKNVKIPLTVKIRSGWDEGHINAVEMSKIAQDCGVDAIFLHPRTKVQGFGGRADWNLIGEVKGSISIPVIGNGDVTTPLLAKRMVEETGCDGVMIGRGALGNPWIFRTENSDPSVKEAAISLEERRRMIDRHFSLLLGHFGVRGAVIKIQKHVYWYTKGLPNCASFHSRLSSLKEKEALLEAIASYFDLIERNPSVTGGQKGDLAGMLPKLYQAGP